MIHLFSESGFNLMNCKKYEKRDLQKILKRRKSALGGSSRAEASRSGVSTGFDPFASKCFKKCYFFILPPQTGLILCGHNVFFCKPRY